MPVRITTRQDGNEPTGLNYLVPAPFVSISKSFQKQGDGEILGSSYAITLEGTLVADRGSPTGTGTFISEPQGTEADPMGCSVSCGDEECASEYECIAAGGEWNSGDLDAIESGLGELDWYQKLQNKQKALSNLIAKMNSGAWLEVLPPTEVESAGFSCHVKLESVDLPTHDPGNPYLCTYTINLTADYIDGPAATPKDNDDWEQVSKWLVSSASETWEITEDKAVYHRHKIPIDPSTQTRYGPTGGGFTESEEEVESEGEEGEEYDSHTKDAGRIFEKNKTYILTRTMSATGKNKFARNNVADGLDVDNYSQQYAANGKAWQQARGFIYDSARQDPTEEFLGYGQRFIFGGNDKEYTGGVPTGAKVTATEASGEGEDAVEASDAALTGSDTDADDVHLFAMNLPVPNNTTDDKNTYKPYDYKRVQSADVRGGSFSITETWVLAPKFSRATETMDFSLQEDTNTGVVTITVNGTIQGLLDNSGLSPTETTTTEGEGEDETTTTTTTVPPDRKADRVTNVKEDFHYEGTDVTTNSKYQNALDHYEEIMPLMFQTVTGVLNDIPDYQGVHVNPTPNSKSIAQQVGTGTITYSLSYTTENLNFIPYIRRESFSVNDTYPGHVAAQHVVLGRKLGPLMQSIGTQTLWQRDLTISCSCNVTREYMCVTNRNQLIPSVGDQETCINNKMQWVANPNFVDVLGSFSKCSVEGHTSQDECESAGGKWEEDPAVTFTNDMILAKPGDANAGSEITGSCEPSGPTTQEECEDPEWEGAWTESSSRADKPATRRIQANAIKKLIDSFDPKTYFLTNGREGATKRVRKRFMNAPQESWDFKTGAWSYSISWIYEINDPYAFPTEDYVDPNIVQPEAEEGEEVEEVKQTDGMEHPYPGQGI